MSHLVWLPLLSSWCAVEPSFPVSPPTLRHSSAVLGRIAMTRRLLLRLRWPPPGERQRPPLLIGCCAHPWTRYSVLPPRPLRLPQLPLRAAHSAVGSADHGRLTMRTSFHQAHKHNSSESGPSRTCHQQHRTLTTNAGHNNIHCPPPFLLSNHLHHLTLNSPAASSLSANPSMLHGPVPEDAPQQDHTQDAM